jgi:hypothetical protein
MFKSGPKEVLAYLQPCPICVQSLLPVTFFLVENKWFEIFPTLQVGRNLEKIQEKWQKFFFEF